MDKIKIYSADRATSIELPRIKNIQVGAAEVSHKVTMASGKVVKDMIGYRPTVQGNVINLRNHPQGSLEF